MTALPPLLSVAAILFGIVLGIRYGRMLHARGVTLSKNIRTREMPLIPCGLVLYVVFQGLSHFVMSNPQWGWNVPETIEYYLLPGIWMARQFFLAFSLCACVTVAWLTHFRGSRALAAVALVFVIATDCLSRYTSLPFLPELTHKTTDGVILQSCAYTCAAATCANIATRLGVPKSEAEMAVLLHTTWSGTSSSQMTYGMRKLGFSARKTLSANRDIGEIRPPAVLLIDCGVDVDAHAVAFMGMDGEKAEIWDPASGKTLQTRETVKARWRGRAIEIGRIERE